MTNLLTWKTHFGRAAATLAASLAPLGFAMKGHPVPIGTFIQWQLCKDWTDLQWQAEFDVLKAVGMSYLVFAPALDSKTREVFYRSSIPNARQTPAGRDLIESVLRMAKKNRFRVFLGLNMHDDWWQDKVHDEAWLMRQMDEGNRVADELFKRYKKRYPETFHGWYWVWEADNYRFATSAQSELLARIIERNLAYVKRLDPKMPFLLCPFMNALFGPPQAYAKVWKHVFANTSFGAGDIFCPQDCCGAGGLNLSNVASWFKELKAAVATKPGLRFWSDAETFDQRYWSSATLDRFVRQLQLTRPYVEEYLTFAYSHYYSPNTINPAWHQAYVAYVRTGKLPEATVANPIVRPLVQNADGSFEIAVETRPGKNGDLGYEVSRDGKVVGLIQVPKERRKPGETAEYRDGATVAEGRPSFQVRAFDVAGHKSEWVEVSYPAGAAAR